jgi:hypothetical protein
LTAATLLAPRKSPRPIRRTTTIPLSPTSSASRCLLVTP